MFDLAKGGPGVVRFLLLGLLVATAGLHGAEAPLRVLFIGNSYTYYNNLAGWGEGSDYLPERFLKEPSDCAGSKGQVTELDRMLEEYYRERGWERGVVPPAKLQELGILSQAADD